MLTLPQSDLLQMSWKASNCARGSNPEYETENELVTFVLHGSLAKAASLKVWYSNLNDTSTTYFEKQKDLEVKDGKVTLQVNVGDIFTITTLTSGGKGNHSVPNPAPFPIPYSDDFEGNSVEDIFSTQMAQDMTCTRLPSTSMIKWVPGRSIRAHRTTMAK